jgi:TolB-like protein
VESSPTSALGREFRAGDWLVQPGEGRIVNAQGEVRLRPMLMDLLVLLAARAGQVVGKNEILERLRNSQFVSESALTSDVAELRRLLGDSRSQPRYIETVSKHGYRFITPVTRSARPEPRLAVLIFENLNRDPEQDYFAEGISDALITELGNIASLRVISRQSVLRYKGTTRSLPEIARELKVDAVIEGSALYADSRFRVSAQLVQADPERHLWAQSYDCPITEILPVQNRIARSIAEAVQAALTPKDLARLSRTEPVNPEAHLAYLKGRYHLSQWTRESVARGFELLQRATAIDPDYAPPFVELGVGLVVLGYWGHMPPREAYAQAKAAAVRALGLDDLLSDAHTVLGSVSWLLDWDMERCEREMRRAVSLNPSSQLARSFYANFLITARDRREEGMREATLALELDPLSLSTNFQFAYMLLFAGEFERARAQTVSMLERSPDCLHAWYARGFAEIGLHEYDAAVTSFAKAVALSPDPFSLAYLGHALGRAGRTAEARAIVDDLRARRGHERVDEFVFFIVHSGLGNPDAAFDAAETCYAERDGRLFWLQAVPCFQPLRGDPRFNDLVRRLRLPPRHDGAHVGA